MGLPEPKVVNDLRSRKSRLDAAEEAAVNGTKPEPVEEAPKAVPVADKPTGLPKPSVMQKLKGLFSSKPKE